MPDVMTRVSELSDKLIANSRSISEQMQAVIRNLQDVLVNPEEGLTNGNVE